MHPLRDDPLYMPCIDIIEDYDSCNGQLWKKFTGQCNDLYEKMSACMKEQVRAPQISMIHHLY